MNLENQGYYGVYTATIAKTKRRALMVAVMLVMFGTSFTCFYRLHGKFIMIAIVPAWKITK